MTRKFSIPEDGLDEIFRSWSGKGQLYEGLASIISDDGYDWKPRHIARRAHRILFEKCRDLVGRLPVEIDDWLKILPVTSQAETVRGASPRGAIDWQETRRNGWPPTEYVGRIRRRGSNVELLTCLRWTVERLLDIYLDAKKMRPAIGDGVNGQLKTLQELLAHGGFANIESNLPDLMMVEGFRRSGPLWRTVGDIADILRQEETRDLWHLATELLIPDDDIAWRVFHLGVLGIVLRVLRDLGLNPISLRPLASNESGVAFRVEVPGGKSWDLWFEAAGVWSSRKVKEPYVAATRGLAKRGSTKGADLFLVDHQRRVGIVIECKYSEPEAVREGYEQVLTYLVEAKTAFIDQGAAFLVAPVETVLNPGVGKTFAGVVEVCSPDHLKVRLRETLQDLGLTR